MERREVIDRAVEKVAAVYAWLDAEIREQAEAAGRCDGCGKCCDFETFDHRLFVTPPEMMYLAAKLGAEDIQPMPTGRCPYNIVIACSIYEYRFAGCRIFCCKGDKDFQSGLSESAVERFKAICTELGIPYRYRPLADTLNGFGGIC